MNCQHKYSLPLISLGLMILGLCQPALAESYFLDTGYAMKRLEFSAQASDASTNYRLAPLFHMFTVTGGVSSDKLYLTGSIEKSLFDAKIDNVTFNADQDKISRSEYSITAGYYVTNRFSLFAGYLNGDTEDHYTSPAGNNEIGQITFSESGLYAGGNYLWFFEKSALSLSLAYALLNGRYEFHYNNNLSSGANTYDGDTRGLSIASKYLILGKQNVNYFLGAKLNLFNFDSDAFSTREDFYVAQAGMNFRF